MCPCLRYSDNLWCMADDDGRNSRDIDTSQKKREKNQADELCPAWNTCQLALAGRILELKKKLIFRMEWQVNYYPCAINFQSQLLCLCFDRMYFLLTPLPLETFTKQSQSERTNPFISFWLHCVRLLAHKDNSQWAFITFALVFFFYCAFCHAYAGDLFHLGALFLLSWFFWYFHSDMALDCNSGCTRFSDSILPGHENLL